MEEAERSGTKSVPHKLRRTQKEPRSKPAEALGGKKGGRLFRAGLRTVKGQGVWER